MTALVRTYNGEDLVIPRKDIEALGLKPGDNVEILPLMALVAREMPPAEREELAKILSELAGASTEEDEANFRRNRQLWSPSRSDEQSS